MDGKRPVLSFLTGLPVNVPHTRPPERPEPPLRGCSVLLVEDDPDQRRLIELLLGTLGAQVTSEVNGRAAVDRIMLARAQIDVIVMDLLMPVLDGAAATATLRAAGCHLPIVAVTAVQESGLRDLCLSAGFTDLLHKPVTRSALVQTILKHVEAGPLQEGDTRIRAVSPAAST